MGHTVKGSGAPRLLAVAACLVIIVAGMKAAASILIPFLLAVFIAVISAPLFLGLQRRGVPVGVALVLMILILVIVGFIGVGISRASLNGFLRNLPKYQARLEEQTASVWEWLAAQGVPPPDQAAAEVLNPQVAMRYLGTVTSALSSALAQAFLILLVVVFILLEAALLPTKLRAMPGMSEARFARLNEIAEKIRRYISLKTVMCLLTGILVTILTAVLGVDYPVLMGLLAFVLNYVPNIGSFIAAIPAVLLAFIELGLSGATMTAIGYVAVNVTVGNVIEPRFMGRGLGLSPLVILISLAFWGWVLGPVGMLLSVPLTMTAKIALEDGEGTRWIALMMGSGIPEQSGAVAVSETAAPDAGGQDGDQPV